MSPLTKLFVVLLVLVSVALSAGTITFVNKLDPLQKDLALKTSKLSEIQTLLDKKSNDAQASLQALEDLQKSSGSEKAALQAQMLQLRSEREDRDAQLAKTNNNLAVATSSINSATTALSASEDAKSKLQEQVTGLRKDADDRLRQVADQGQRINKLVADLDQTEKARRNLAEQLTDASGRADRQSKLLKDMGVTDGQLQNAGTGAGAPAVNGVIRSRRNIAGKEYATISIGSQDYVTKGMQFKIIDAQSGMFLGLLSVEVVDQNEAMGQIVAEPQNLAQIKAGNVVKTQI
ncbi:MAG: hypothetical protein JWM57_1022 [Phycisphaerales bacterium]|nr:hypothetical protein [Phycisphaerales bacterium]